jgi:DNA modification methylase
MGSGSTGLACVELGRQFIGIEINEKYFEIALERITIAAAQGRFNFD